MGYIKRGFEVRNQTKPNRCLIIEIGTVARWVQSCSSKRNESGKHALIYWDILQIHICWYYPTRHFHHPVKKTLTTTNGNVFVSVACFYSDEGIKLRYHEVRSLHSQVQDEKAHNLSPAPSYRNVGTRTPTLALFMRYMLF